MSDTSEKSEKSSGGFHIGNVGGDVKMRARGDIVGGDKKTTTTTTTTITKGFAGDQQKQQFQAEIDQLREALRAMKAEIEANASLDQNKKDEVVGDIVEQVKDLQDVKEETAAVPTGKPAPAEIAAKVEGALDRAGGIVEKLQGVATKGGELAETVGKFALKYGPLILSARHLFGLP